MHYKLYLILAHDKPLQLQALINKLNDDHSVFIIHIDKDSTIASFKSIINAENVFFLENRLSCIWGNVSIVRATLLLIEFALNLKKEGHLILLSGACMPLVSNAAITNFLSANKNVNFIDIYKAEQFLDPEESSRRFFSYTTHFRPRLAVSIKPIHSISSFLYELRRVVKFILLVVTEKRYHELVNLKEFTQKRTSFFSENYGGSQWWAFTRSTAIAILDHTKNNPEHLNQYTFTHAPDEIFFQTLVMNLPEVLKSVTFKPSLTYANWSRKGVPLPVTFKREDLNELAEAKSENYLFARKFDIGIDNFFITELPIIDHSTEIVASKPVSAS